MTKVLPPSDYVILKSKKSAPQVVHGDKLKPCHSDTPTSWLPESQTDIETITGTTDDVTDSTAGQATRDVTDSTADDVTAHALSDSADETPSSSATDDSSINDSSGGTTVETADGTVDSPRTSILRLPGAERRGRRTGLRVHFDEETRNKPTPIIHSPMYRHRGRPVKRRVHFDESSIRRQPTQRFNQSGGMSTDRQPINSTLWPTNDGSMMEYASQRPGRDRRLPSRFQDFQM